VTWKIIDRRMKDPMKASSFPDLNTRRKAHMLPISGTPISSGGKLTPALLSTLCSCTHWCTLLVTETISVNSSTPNPPANVANPSAITHALSHLVDLSVLGGDRYDYVNKLDYCYLSLSLLENLSRGCQVLSCLPGRGKAWLLFYRR
jgi:hypothetical protein